MSLTVGDRWEEEWTDGLKKGNKMAVWVIRSSLECFLVTPKVSQTFGGEFDREKYILVTFFEKVFPFESRATGKQGNTTKGPPGPIIFIKGSTPHLTKCVLSTTLFEKRRSSNVIARELKDCGLREFNLDRTKCM